MIGDGILQRRATKPHAVTPGRERATDMQVSFAGGLNITSVEDALSETQFRRGDNVRLLPYGSVQERGGTQRTGPQLAIGQPVLNGHIWRQADGDGIILAVCDGKLFRTEYGTFPLTWTQVAGALSDPQSHIPNKPRALQTGVPPSFQNFIEASGAEVVYIADGGLLNKYNGTILTENIPNTAPVKQICVHNERLWGVGDTSRPQSVFYSALNNGDTLGHAASGGGEIIVRTFGNQATMGIASLATSLLVFHTRGVSRITGFGQDDISVQPAGISSHVGTIAPFSIVNVNNAVYFVSERGLFVADEREVIPVSSPEKPDPLAQIIPELSALEISEIRCEYYRATRELLIWVPGIGIYVFHTILNSWSGPWIDGFLNPEVVCLFETANVDGYPIMFAGDMAGYVRELDRPQGLDNVAPDGTGGTAYTMAFQPRRFYCQAHHVAKAWRYAYVLASMHGTISAALAYQTGTASSTKPFPFLYDKEWGEAASEWGEAESIWGGGGQFSFEFALHGNGYYIDLTITDSSPARPIISQAGVLGFVLGRR